jgi:hypothetical protein
MNEKHKNLLIVFTVAFALTLMVLMLALSPPDSATGLAAKGTQSKDCASYCDKHFKEFDGWIDCHEKCMKGKTG